MKPIIPLILKPSHLQRDGARCRVPDPSKRFTGWFLRQLDTDGFATYRSAEDPHSGVVLTMEEMEQFTEKLLEKTYPELRRRGLVSSNQMLTETGRHGPETVQRGANIELHQDWNGQKKVIAMVNQQQHGSRFQAGGERIMLDLHDRRLPPVTANNPKIRQLEVERLPKHFQRRVIVPENVAFTTIFNNQRIAHGATLIKDTGVGPYDTAEGRQQSIWEYVDDSSPFSWM